jgi:hypothetical protein
MGLFAPWFLAGAAAVGLPVYLHLLRRQTTTPTPFSSLMFFEPRTQSSIRHRRLRYLLLLAFRVALLVLLALAFANPFVKRPAASVPTGRLSLIVLDDSFSMRAGTRMSDAKREAMSVLGSRRSSGPMQVMALDSQLHALTSPTPDEGTLRAAVESVQPGDSRSNFGELVRAASLMAEEAHSSIELHLFSDMQRTSVAPGFSEMALPDSLSLVLHPVVKGVVPNWTVESVAAPSQLWGNPREGKPVRVQAVVTGYLTPAATRTVSLLVNGRSSASKSVQVPAGGRATVEFESLDVPYGFSRCEIRIDSADALPADDGYLFAVERSDPQRVLFVHAGNDTRSPRYFGDALGSAAESAFQLQSVTFEQMAGLSLSKYAFIVFADVAGLTSSLESELLKYVSDGGSVMVAMGPSSARRGRIFGETIQAVHDYSRELPRGREPFLSVGESDMSHASVGRAGSLSGVKFYYAVAVDAANSHVVARLTDRTPLLLDKKVGEGRVLFFASGLDNVTNDFPLHPAFVAFVDGTARYLSRAARSTGTRLVDSFLDLRTSPGGPGESVAPGSPGRTGVIAASGQTPARNLGVEVIDPAGHRPLSLKEAATTQSLRLSLAGFYEVRLASGRQDVIAVNPDRRESNLETAPDDLLTLWRGSPKRPGPTAASAGPASQREERFSLWWYIMMASLLAALAESLLASRYLGTRRDEVEVLTREAS